MPGPSIGDSQRINHQKQISAPADTAFKVRALSAKVIFAALAFVFLPAALSAQGTYTETVLYSFCQQGGYCPDGDGPQLATPIFDSQGNLYGTAEGGGANNAGDVYQLTPNGNGTWTQSVLYSFAGGPTDGSSPRSALIFDSQGNLYGTTAEGGNLGYTCGEGCGTVFELSPAGNGTWTEHVLYVFCQSEGCPDGSGPNGPLIFDSHGNLYGTTSGGGSSNQYGEGVVFELSPNGGSWTETVLYAFVCNVDGSCPNGRNPTAALIFDSAGNLYSTTQAGGANNFGTVFELSPSGGGWNETVIYSFGQLPDGENPSAPVIMDTQGNLYGTTGGGGQNSPYGGVVFELSPNGQGGWTEQILLNFNISTPYGYGPGAGLILDAHGDLYGTTPHAGHSAGTAYELSPAGNGQWTPTLLYGFGGAGGSDPGSAMVFDAHGNLYGTAGSGLYDAGVVYELSPPQLISTTTALMSAPNPSNLGQSVTMTATVTAQNGSLPTGMVMFQSNGVPIGSAMLNNSGVAVLNDANLPGGTDSLVAMYGGSTTLAPSTSNTVQQIVNPAASTTTVTSAPNPSISGGSVTITATVGPSGPPAPTGTVAFSSNGTAISGCTSVPLASSMAQCMTTALPTGTDNLVAAYSGDGNYQGSSGMLTQFVNPVPNPLQLFTVAPCRLVDTRGPDGTFGGPALQGNTSRSFPLPQNTNCNVPDSAVAYSLNVTVVPHRPLGYLTIWPTGEGQPVVSTMNSPDGRIKANAALVPAGTDGAVSVYVTDTTDVILDIDGYFAPATTGSYEFYSLTPCRVIDTRAANGDLGGPYLHAQVERDFPVLESSCIPSGVTIAAYSMNFTVVPYPAGQALGYLTVWPQGQMQPVVSTLNNPTATVVANAAIVPAGTNGEIATYAFNSTDLIVDINGYFAAPGQGQNGYSFYVVAPCRAFDSRANNGQPFTGELTVNIAGSPCAPPSNAAGYVFNATVVPSASLGYLTLWPDGETQPVVSTLNAYDGFITSNMAIVPNMDGSTDAFAGQGYPGPGSGYTQLILDISGYFAP